jgi:hypothetical protein
LDYKVVDASQPKQQANPGRGNYLDDSKESAADYSVKSCSNLCPENVPDLRSVFHLYTQIEPPKPWRFSGFYFSKNKVCPNTYDADPYIGPETDTQIL